MRVGTLALAAVLSFAPHVSAATTVSNVVIQTSTIGTGQTHIRTRSGHIPGFSFTSYLPAGDPFSSASMTVEFTVSGGGATILLFGNLPETGKFPGFSEDEILALGGGPVPWNVSVSFVRVTPNPSVFFFADESNTQTLDSNDNFEWADTGFQISDGRYRFSVYASQVGGAIPAGVWSSISVHPIPEPAAFAAFALGVLAVGCAVLRMREDA